jgi:hypothetical protein
MRKARLAIEGGVYGKFQKEFLSRFKRNSGTVK